MALLPTYHGLATINRCVEDAASSPGERTAQAARRVPIVLHDAGSPCVFVQPDKIRPSRAFDIGEAEVCTVPKHAAVSRGQPTSVVVRTCHPSDTLTCPAFCMPALVLSQAVTRPSGSMQRTSARPSPLRNFISTSTVDLRATLLTRCRPVSCHGQRWTHPSPGYTSPRQSQPRHS